MLEAFLLGLIQGLTELLPVSSSGHLLLLPFLSEELGLPLNFSFQDTSFDIALHVATFLAISLFYARSILVSWKGLEPKARKDFLRNIALTSTPALAFGGLLVVIGDDWVKTPSLTAWLLIIIGVIFIVLDRQWRSSEGSGVHPTPKLDLKPLAALPARAALIIGFFQAGALFRGTSRSGASLIGGYTQGLSRLAALDYAFIASLPLFAILTAYEVVKLIKDFNAGANQIPVAEMLVGGGTAFLVSLVVLQFFRRIVRLPGAFIAFGFYRVALGFLVLLLVGN